MFYNHGPLRYVSGEGKLFHDDTAVNEIFELVLELASAMIVIALLSYLPPFTKKEALNFELASHLHLLVIHPLYQLLLFLVQVLPLDVHHVRSTHHRLESEFERLLDCHGRQVPVRLHETRKVFVELHTRRMRQRILLACELYGAPTRSACT